MKKKIGISRDLIIHPGETIADVLEERGISQVELASWTGVTPAYISNVIAGKIRNAPSNSLVFEQKSLLFVAHIIVPILTGIFITAGYFTTMNGGVNIFRCHPGDNALLFYLTAGLMSLSLFILTSIVFRKANKNIQLISEGTLLIFAVHQSILWPLHEHLTHGLVSFLVAVGLITVFCPFISLCKKYAPVLIGKWK